MPVLSIQTRYFIESLIISHFEGLHFKSALFMHLSFLRTRFRLMVMYSTQSSRSNLTASFSGSKPMERFDSAILSRSSTALVCVVSLLVRKITTSRSWYNSPYKYLISTCRCMSLCTSRCQLPISLRCLPYVSLQWSIFPLCNPMHPIYSSTWTPGATFRPRDFFFVCPHPPPCPTFLTKQKLLASLRMQLHQAFPRLSLKWLSPSKSRSSSLLFCMTS